MEVEIEVAGSQLKGEGGDVVEYGGGVSRREELKEEVVE